MCVPYLYDGEGMSDRNSNIMYQIMLLKQALRLPLLCVGDFDLTPDEMKASGWLSKLGVVARAPTDTTTTTTLSADRIIDYVLVSSDTAHLVQSVKVHLAGPWRPHFGIEVTLNARPNSISGPKLIAPKPLPVDDAAVAFNKLSDYQKWHKWKNAARKARTKLRAAKLATGFAI